MHAARMKSRGTTDPRPAATGRKSQEARWHSVKKRFPEGTGWRDFDHFASTVGIAPSYNSVLNKVDDTKLVGPSNFCWKARDVTNRERSEIPIEDRRKKIELSRKYGIDLDEYRAKLLAQNGVCAICSLPETKAVNGSVISLSVDHDHSTGVPRGLLCNNCNRALGLFGDNPQTLTAAVAYLSAHQSGSLNVIPFRKEA